MKGTPWTPRMCGGTRFEEPEIRVSVRDRVRVVEIIGPIVLVDTRGEFTSKGRELQQALSERPALLVIDSECGETRSSNFLSDIVEFAGRELAVHIVRACGSSLLGVIECPVRFGDPQSVAGDLREFFGGKQDHSDICPDYIAKRCEHQFTLRAWEQATRTGMVFGAELAEHYGIITHLMPSLDHVIETLSCSIVGREFGL